MLCTWVCVKGRLYVFFHCDLLLIVIGIGVDGAGFVYICFMFSIFASCVSWSKVVCVPMSLFWW